MKKILLFILTVLLSGLAHARDPKVKTVTFEDNYQIHSKERFEEARLNAITQAKLKAIEKEFGTSLSQTNYSYISNSNTGEYERFNSFAKSDVNGEWIESIYENADPITQNGLNFFHVKIKGKIRELIYNRIPLDWAIMANGTDPQKDKVRNDTFMAGEYLYVYFMSPVDGYLVIYIADCDEEQMVQCLVPYRGVNEGAMKIEANKPYVFFSREHADESIKDKVGRIKVNCHNDVDYNRLHILFSPNEFSKTIDNDAPSAIITDMHGNEIHTLPRQLDFKTFQGWLADTRLRDPDMQNLGVIFKIEKRTP